MGERREQLVSKVLLCVHAEYVARPNKLNDDLVEMNKLLDSLACYARVQLEGHLCPNSFQDTQEIKNLKIARIESNQKLDDKPFPEIPDEMRWNRRWCTKVDEVRTAMQEARKECEGGVAYSNRCIDA
jgi:hypothetical protein